MVRNYARKTKPIDKEQLAKALEAVRLGKSMNSAAKEYGLNTETLRTHVNRSTTRKQQTQVDKHQLTKAIAAVEYGKAISTAAEEFGLNRATLNNYVQHATKLHYQVSFVVFCFGFVSSHQIMCCLYRCRFSTQNKKRL